MDGDAAITSVFVSYVEIKNLIYSRQTFPKWTEPELERVQQSIASFKESARSTFQKYQPSEMGTSKWHAFDHLIRHMREVGGGQYLHSKLFEQTHEAVKRHYQITLEKTDSFMTGMTSPRKERECFEKMLPNQIHTCKTNANKLQPIQQDGSQLVRSGASTSVAKMGEPQEYLSTKSRGKTIRLVEQVAPCEIVANLQKDAFRTVIDLISNTM